MTLFDGLEDALVGYSDVWMADGTKVERAVYDGEKIVYVLMQRGMTKEEALDWIDFSIEGAYVGPSTPVVFWADADL
jgi:hypothetical protein